eukprot:TRINITY_DN72051_c0_g1_i1.p1 TRINITY_DN72051_c0_g1~~TRINITY_DN72051_c0_g1_i1.p1  ORF type:complete len:649 (-),score=69.04 TRINITY_DN72051_c0_g1_i1:139-2004(-)
MAPPFPCCLWICLQLCLTSAEASQPSVFPFVPNVTWSVLLDGHGRVSLRQSGRGRTTGAAAWGSYVDAINTTGWAVLDLHSSASFDGEQQSYAVGYLEGWLTQRRISQHLNNMWGIDFPDDSPGSAPMQVRKFVERNVQWMQEQVSSNSSKVWRLVGFLLEQLRGLCEGYNAARQRYDKELSVIDMLMLTMVDTDMDAVVTATSLNLKNVNRHFIHSDHNHRRHSGHCSAMVQLAPDRRDLWVAHATWDSYRAMLRMVKYLDMPLPGVSARRMVFTANPSNLYSADDFYMLDTGLTVLETSLTNYNKTSWSLVRPESLLTWARTMVANRLATTGSEWTDLQLFHFSGTCNNQWMVVDYKLFSPGKPLANGTLWISETMPGYSRRADVTDVLHTRGVWPSYNIPYFKDVWSVGGWQAMQQKSAAKADEYSYARAPRARMFERAWSEGKITDLSSLMHFVRHNDIEDPLSKHDACNSISARCDLNQQSRPEYDCFGAVDAKIAYMRHNPNDLSFYAVASPAFDGARPFSWSAQDPRVDGCAPNQHVGHPDIFNFSFYAMPSSWNHAFPQDAEPEQRADGLVAAQVFIGLCLSLVLGSMAFGWFRKCRRSATADHDHGYKALDW